jgi:hypothetical protein
MREDPGIVASWAERRPDEDIGTQGIRITGAARAELAARLKASYDGGASVRQLAEEIGRSYGAVHRLLLEGGTELRSRGGSRRLQD